MCKTWLQLKKKGIELRDLIMKWKSQLVISQLMQGIIDAEVLRFFWGVGGGGGGSDSVRYVTFILASLVLVQPRKTGPYIIERSLMGRKESIQTNKIKITISLTANPQTGILAKSEVQIKGHKMWYFIRYCLFC